MTSDALRIAKINLKIERTRANNEMLKTMMSNPVVELIGAYVLVESLQKAAVIPDKAGTACEIAIVAAVGMQQLAPLAPYIAQRVEGLGQGLAGIAKMAGTAALAGGG